MAIRRLSWLHNLIRGSDVSRHEAKMLALGCGWAAAAAFCCGLAFCALVFSAATSPAQRSLVWSYSHARLLTLFFLEDKPVSLAFDAGGRRQRWSFPAHRMLRELQPSVTPVFTQLQI